MWEVIGSISGLLSLLLALFLEWDRIKERFGKTKAVRVSYTNDTKHPVCLVIICIFSITFFSIILQALGFDPNTIYADILVVPIGISACVIGAFIYIYLEIDRRSWGFILGVFGFGLSLISVLGMLIL